MKVFQLTALGVLALTYQCFDTDNRAVADENGPPTPISNPHHLFELGPFVRLPAVRKELQLTDEQIVDVDVFAQILKERFEKFTEQQTGLESAEDGKALFLRFCADQALFRGLADAVFNPVQLNRLKQMASQHVTRNPRGSFGVLGTEMRKELGITADQAKTLDEKSARMAEQLQRREAELKLELEKLRTKLRAEVVESLDPDQRAKLKGIWGELVPIPQ